MKNLTQIKFKENGDFNIFRGNTVVANLYHQEKLMEVVDYIQAEYRKLPFINKFTLTPRHSIHMTVIELLCDQNREPEFWSQDIDLDLPIDDVSDYFAEKLDVFPLQHEKILMETTEMGKQNILVRPANDFSQKRLEAIREYVSEKTGVKFPNHDSYQFHISIGYLRVPLTEEEERVFAEVRQKISQVLRSEIPLIGIERIDYTVFDDMTQFIPYKNKN